MAESSGVITRGDGHARNILQMLAKGAAAQSEIVASWDRCVRLHRLHPERDTDETVVTQTELRDAVEPFEHYLRTAEIELNNIAEQIAKLDFFLSVANSDGITLTHRGSVPELGAMRMKVQDGMCWSESAQGTNAIGTGLYSGRPMVIYRGEHFFKSNTGMTCLVAPLFGPSGRLLGALNISTLNPKIDRNLASVLQTFLVGAAQKLELLWFRESNPGALVIAVPDVTSASGSSPLLAVDLDLNVLGATHAARAHCRITPAALEAGLQLDQIQPTFPATEPSLWNAERAALKRALAMSDQNVSVAANHLRISRATMHRKMAMYSLSRKRRTHS